MSALSVRERGDLAKQMLPVAAELAVLVHGDGGPEDVQAVLDGLGEAQRLALIVVLAGLVDPDQPLGKALGWLDFNEDGALTVPSWGEAGSVRDLVPEPELVADDEFVDEVAVRLFLEGAAVEVTDAEFLVAVQRAMDRGLSCAQLDALRREPAKSTATRLYRLRKRYQRAGRVFPVNSPHPSGDFTAEQVVEIREVYAAGGVTDLDLALRWGVSRKTMSSLLSGLSYRDAGGPVRPRRVSGKSEGSRRVFAGHTDALLPRAS